MTLLMRCFRLLGYLFLFMWELIKANIQMAGLVLSPRFKFKSAAVRYKTKVKTVPEMILLANSITLTPGTLVVDANLKKGELLVHVMSADDPEQICKNIEKSLEKRVLWVLK